ncbi:MAG: glutathione S-transferase N-terminal domain-containing protein [Proteobacteria bacterium]|nr:glutathione S-transferase N-terminal domain-containing protein [Pseudomonadota bacterium]
MMNRTFDLITATVGAVARLGSGIHATRGAVVPNKLVELYEFEASPFCRKVREALTELDLDAMIYPCPRGGKVHRPRAIEIGGKKQFPFLVDPNTGQTLYESADIVDYLFDRYGNGRPSARLRIGPLANTTSFLATAVRLHRGVKARPSRQPDQPLELYSIEASPFCRLVRETLCELELAYKLRNLGRGPGLVDYLPPGLRYRFAPGKPYTTVKRRQFAERTGRVMVPYLLDPNTGVELFESADIVQYLVETYAL